MFAWCPSGKLFSESQVADARYWVTPPDGTASTKRCLELNYDASKDATLASADCSTGRFKIQDSKYFYFVKPSTH
jgi:hypothetical protein